jgi:hypothetical protein
LELFGEGGSALQIADFRDKQLFNRPADALLIVFGGPDPIAPGGNDLLGSYSLGVQGIPGYKSCLLWAPVAGSGEPRQCTVFPSMLTRTSNTWLPSALMKLSHQGFELLRVKNGL